MDERWSQGTWLGKSWRQDAHLVYCDGEVVESRAIRSLPPGESWVANKIQQVKATPWCTNPEEAAAESSDTPEIIRAEAPPQEDVVAEEKDPDVRGVRIEVPDLVAFGYTKSCRKCDILLSGARPNLPARACRSLMRATPPTPRSQSPLGTFFWGP